MSDVHELTRLVLDKIEALGEAGAKEYFDVSAGTISAWRNGKHPPSLAAAQRAYDESLRYQTPEVIADRNTTVALLLPMLDTMDPLTFFTLFRCLKLYGPEKVSMIPKMRTLIDEARCDLAEKALLTTAEYFIYCDADMILPCGNGAMLRKQGLTIPEPKISRNAIERLMSHGSEAKIVGALYRDRRGGTKAQCAKGFMSPQENARMLGLFDGSTKGDGLEEVGWVGFGLVRVHRSVFTDMKEAAKPGGPLADIAPPKGREGEPYGFFGRTSQWRGEDVAYCRRAGQIGIKTYVDTGLLCGHRGEKIY